MIKTLMRAIKQIEHEMRSKEQANKVSTLCMYPKDLNFNIMLQSLSMMIVWLSSAAVDTTINFAYIVA